MRFIYTVLLGMVIFQAMMIIIAPIFPSSVTGGFDPAGLGQTPGDTRCIGPHLGLQPVLDGVF